MAHEKYPSVEHDGHTYKLNMTRAGLRAAEAQGFTVTEMSEKPFSALTHLFFASLFSGYKLNPGRVGAMLDDLLEQKAVDFQALYEDLVEAYTELFGSGESEK